jgi:hypothetical protein
LLGVYLSTQVTEADAPTVVELLFGKVILPNEICGGGGPQSINFIEM